MWGKWLASGKTADIHQVDEERVAKVFRPDVDRSIVLMEQRKTAAVHGVGLSVPKVGDIVEEKGRIALLFQRVHGPTMQQAALSDPASAHHLASLLADLHWKMHAVEAPEALPFQFEVVKHRIERTSKLSRDLKKSLIERASRLVKAKQLCHGDFHPGNIVQSKEGLVIIDWNDAVAGEPIADVARTSLLLLGHVETEVESPEEAGFIRLFHQTYLHRYMTRCSRWDEYRMWLPIVAAVRLTEKVPHQVDWLKSIAERQD